jgi:hypothetical protein
MRVQRHIGTLGVGPRASGFGPATGGQRDASGVDSFPPRPEVRGPRP